MDAVDVQDALRSYLDHPVRKRYLVEHLAPIEEQRIEIDMPVDMSLRPTPVATGNGAPASGWDRRSTGDQQSSSRAAADLSARRAAFVYAFVMSGMKRGLGIGERAHPVELPCLPGHALLEVGQAVERLLVGV